MRFPLRRTSRGMRALLTTSIDGSKRRDVADLDTTLSATQPIVCKSLRGISRVAKAVFKLADNGNVSRER